MKKKAVFCVLILLLGLLFACKKEAPEELPDIDPKELFHEQDYYDDIIYNAGVMGYSEHMKEEDREVLYGYLYQTKPAMTWGRYLEKRGKEDALASVVSEAWHILFTKDSGQEWANYSLFQYRNRCYLVNFAGIYNDKTEEFIDDCLILEADRKLMTYLEEHFQK